MNSHEIHSIHNYSWCYFNYKINCFDFKLIMLYSIFLFCNFNSIPKSTYPSETKHPLLQLYPLQQQPLNPPLALIHLSRKLNTAFIEHNRFPHVNTTARWVRLLSASSFKSCINFELACPSMLASQSLSISENTRSHEDNPPTPFFEGERVGGGGSQNRFISSLLPRHRLIMNRWYTHTSTFTKLIDWGIFKSGHYAQHAHIHS